MKRLLLLHILLVSTIARSQSQNDYTLYHKGIIKAEHEIFVGQDAMQGLKDFKKTFDAYDFVFVDDCIEAFELALYYKREDYAMPFIKKALDNGFELKFLDTLSDGCPCNNYMGLRNRVSIHQAFIQKHRQELDAYAAAHYDKYVARIDKHIFSTQVKQHVKEQLYKNYHSELGMTQKKQEAAYVSVMNDNLHFMDSLMSRKIYFGERNLGIYTDKLAEALHLPFISIENYLTTVLQSYGMPKNTYVPILHEGEYWDIGPAYNMLFHNPHTFDVITKYKDEAIKTGYMHPREYASLMFNTTRAHIPDSANLYLEPTNGPKLTNTQSINKRRAELLLPDYETDYAKHLFAHEHQLKLCFGFFNGTR